MVECCNRVKATIERYHVDGQERELDWSDDARSQWCKCYEMLSDARPGMFGAITARAEAQVVRLALIYALLDGADQIESVHLRAALAVWRYSEASAAFIFGSACGDPIADRALSAIRAAGANGLSRAELNGLFSGHRIAAALDRALALLQQHGLVAIERRATAGRPAEIWRSL